MITDLLKRLILQTETPQQAMLLVCEHLHEEYDHYDWVGFYLVDPDNDHELILGPYVGAPTDHDRIAFGTGVCGQSAAGRCTMNIPDVRAESNYLSCSLHVRSEMVVPVVSNAVLVGVLDIDSHSPEAFTDDDRQRLETIAAEIARLF